jgi:uncharacterized SAM-binding protein YcdF (DUF218 family)
VRIVARVVAVFVVLATLYLSVTFFQVWRASRSGEVTTADAIVVLGAAQYDGVPSPVLQSRLDHAIALREQGVASTVVVTGGNQPGDRETEASAGARYLREHGVPEEHILQEVAGTNSWQSLAGAARFLKEEGMLDVVLVSSPYHALRTEEIADEVGLRGSASPAPGSPEGTAAQLGHLGRETVAVGIGRIVGFGRLVRIDEQVERVRSGSGTG